MLEVASEKLTERERECLKHFRSEGERVACGQARDGSQGTDAAWAGWRAEEEAVEEEASEIHSRPCGVRRGVTLASAALACRVRHPSGCVIECVSWPDPSWIMGVLGAQP